jgi:prefoldin subunit 5
MYKDSAQIEVLSRRLEQVAREIRLIQQALAGITATEPTGKSSPVEIKSGGKTYTI